MARRPRHAKVTNGPVREQDEPPGGRRVIRLVIVSIIVLFLLLVSVPLTVNSYLGEIYLKRGVTDLAAKRYVDAELAFRLAVEKKPNSWRSHYHLGIARAAAGKRDGAIDAYRDTLRLHPNYAAALTDLGGELVQRGDRDKSKEDYEEAKTYLDRSLELAPEHPKSLYFMAVCESRMEEWVDARRHFEMALTAGYESKANLYQNLAVVSMKLGNQEEALDHFNKALKEGPDDPAVNYQAGIFLNKIGRYDEARKSLLNAARVISTDKTNPDISLLRSVLEGLVFVTLDGLKNPSVASFHLRQYTLYAGRSPKAASLVDKLIASISTDEFVRDHPEQLPRMNYNVSSALLNVGRIDEALGRIRTHLVAVSDQRLAVAVQVLLARCHLARNDTRAALSALRTAESIKPDDNELWRTYGQLFVQTGRDKDAVEAFRKALELNADDEISRSYLKKLSSR